MLLSIARAAGVYRTSIVRISRPTLKLLHRVRKATRFAVRPRSLAFSPNKTSPKIRLLRLDLISVVVNLLIYLVPDAKARHPTMHYASGPALISCSAARKPRRFSDYALCRQKITDLPAEGHRRSFGHRGQEIQPASIILAPPPAPISPSKLAPCPQH